MTAQPKTVAGVQKTRKSFKKTNWQLIIGVLFVLLVVGAAIYGPQLAPKDPLQQNVMIRAGDEWHPAPLRAFEVPEYPLGTDQFGRDLFSQLLFAVRPTMILISIVAVVRLALGLFIGLLAGWNEGRLGRLLDNLISGALAIPVLIVALGAIAMLNVGEGIGAFILGLALTGWANAARMVREQTRQIKQQLYVEAAHSLGAPDFQIIFRHILRHIMPMVWMLFSFEISATLLVTAGLGFLGYYIGGSAFVVTSDTALTRTSGLPELGQMLATSWISLTEPWGLFAAGLAVLIIVLGFNMLGEGLRRNLTLQNMGRRTLFQQLNNRYGLWIEHHISYPLGNFAQSGVGRVVLWGLPVLLVAWYGYGLLTAPAEADTPVEIALPVPGEHMWGAERHDPYGTLWTTALGPARGDIEWEFQDPDGFTGGLVIDANGTLYVTSFAGRVLALAPTGETLWTAQLPAQPVGTPALSAEGDLYVTDDQGALTSYSPQGDLRWRYEPEVTRTASAGPIVGPDGTVYYANGAIVLALTTEGTLTWTGQASYDLRPTAPRLSPDGQFVLLDNIALRTADGALQQLDAVEEAAEGTNTGFARFYHVVDPDGRAYLVSRNVAAEWQSNAAGDGGEVVQRLTWDPNLTLFGDPADMGITPDQVVWRMFTANIRFDTIVQWIAKDGTALGNVQYTHRPSVVLALDRENTIYTCGFDRENENMTECLSWSPGEEEANWRLVLDQPQGTLGGAVVDGRVYIVTNSQGIGGRVYAVGAYDGEPQVFHAPARTAASDPNAGSTEEAVEDGEQTIDDFFNNAFGSLLARDPENITEIGISEMFGMDNSELTTVTPAYQRETYAMVEAHLDALHAYDYESLTPEQQLSYDIFEWYLDDWLREQAFMFYDYPFNQIFGEQTDWVDFMTNAHPVTNITEARAYVTRLGAFSAKATQWVEWLTAQQEAGVILPRFVIEHVLTQLHAVTEQEVSEHVLVTSFAEKVNSLGSLTDVQKDGLIGGAQQGVTRGVMPGYRRLILYFEELLAASNDDAGVWKHPDGEDFYAFALRRHTTTDMTAEEIHALGLDEVARIQAEMEAIFAEFGITGETLQEKMNQAAVMSGFTASDDETIAMYEALIDEAYEVFAASFDLRPEVGLEVVPFHSPTGAGAFYVRAPVDGSRPGMFYVNLNEGTPLYGMPTLTYHEAVPGHHFQIGIQQELGGLPYFRNGVNFTAYAEGWALYAEYLALGAGLYDDDPLGNLGRLQGELFRAARLVADTGLHAMGWTREETIDYMVQNTGYSEGFMTAEVERYIVWPGQATSYKIGMLKILELRHRAEEALGDAFDLKEFHNVILQNGAMPLDILEQVVEAWIESEQ